MDQLEIRIKIVNTCFIAVKYKMTVKILLRPIP